MLLKTEIQIKDNFKWKKQENRKPYRKLTNKENLQDAFDVALADTQTVNYKDDTSLDDLETVDYNNDTSVTDVVLVRNLKTIKENDNDDIEVIKTVQRVFVSDDNDDDDDDDDDDDVEFSKQMLLHTMDRLKPSEKKYLQILPKKKLIQRSKNQSKDIEYIKKVPPYSRERLNCKNRLKDEPVLKYLKTVPSDPRDRLSRRLKNAPANIVCDE